MNMGLSGGGRFGPTFPAKGVANFSPRTLCRLEAGTVCSNRGFIGLAGRESNGFLVPMETWKGSEAVKS